MEINRGDGFGGAKPELKATCGQPAKEQEAMGWYPVGGHLVGQLPIQTVE